MDYNPPTAADFAYADANTALKQNRDLEKRLADLERRVAELEFDRDRHEMERHAARK